jgi:hypothetical protein
LVKSTSRPAEEWGCPGLAPMRTPWALIPEKLKHEQKASSIKLLKNRYLILKNAEEFTAVWWVD